eukprot:TRINITY_DN3256_c0_g1_i2.p1 TRINITY_DN3256_c0_g1~~TRINITY_DN3256_c0_g1_i2.p1  ORF type:complete len:140 (-),score=33.25 TRINITY_DN3256_c0_g1_i2:438-857(-)
MYQPSKLWTTTATLNDFVNDCAQLIGSSPSSTIESLSPNSSQRPIYHFPLLTNQLCGHLQEELFQFVQWSMKNNKSLHLDRLGVNLEIDLRLTEFVKEVLHPIALNIIAKLNIPSLIDITSDQLELTAFVVKNKLQTKG